MKSIYEQRAADIERQNARISYVVCALACIIVFGLIGLGH